MQLPPTAPPELRQVLTLVRWLLILLFIVLAWVVLAYLAHVLAPILAALGIAYLLNPVVEGLGARGLSRTLAAGLVLVAFLATIVVGIVLAAPAVAEQVAEFAYNLPAFVQNIITGIEERFRVELPQDWKAYLASDEARGALEGASGPLGRIAEAALGGVFGVLAVLAELLLVPVFAFYFLSDWPNLWRRLEHMVPPRRRANVRELVRQIDGVVSNWVRGQAIVTLILAVLYAICFSIVGMPLSVPIGLLVGALTVIPFVGTIVGAAITALVALGAGASGETIAMVGGVFVVLHLLEAAVLTPKIVGHRVGLGEASALLAVVAGGKLLGFVGVVLAVPIAATVAVLVRYAIRYYETTAFFGRESDADVDVTPAMALILPGRPWTWTGTGVGAPAARSVLEAIALETSSAAAPPPVTDAAVTDVAATDAAAKDPAATDEP